MHRKIALFALLAILTLTGFHRAYAVYDPTIGRWISRDPLNNAEMLQGPNLYVYVGNNPVDRTDPTGLFFGVDDAIEADVAISSAVGTAIGEALVNTAVGVGAINFVASLISPEDEDDEYKPSNRDKKCDKNNKMGGEDKDPFKGKGPPKGTDDYDKARREIENIKNSTGRGGADNIDPDNVDY